MPNSPERMEGRGTHRFAEPRDVAREVLLGRRPVRMDGHIGVYALPGAVEVQEKILRSWSEVDELVVQLRRSAKKAFGIHPHANNNAAERG